MKVTFPHMGNVYVSAKVLFETAEIEYVIPPLCNKITLSTGIIHSPEFACLPFKGTLGDFIYGIENGADYILFGGGCGQCRLGYYGDLHAEILKDLGYTARFIYLDLSNMSIKEAFEKLKPLAEGKRRINIFMGIIYALDMVFRMDNLENLARYIRCRENNKGETDRIMKGFEFQVRKVRGYKAVKTLIKSTKRLLKRVEIDRKARPLRIALVGEIYAAIEPYFNMELERKLGNLGVEVHNKLSISHWIMEHLIKNMMPFKTKNKPHEAGKEFMKTDDIGGHGLETIGNSVLCGLKKFDGVIQVYPFTCMPEIIAQSTFSYIQDKYKINIMTLIVDEMTGDTGYATRIEAFVDMLQRKREIDLTQLRQSPNIQAHMDSVQ